ncbi:MAG: cell division protein ZipA C-terminal FtsZ-binding domain-containing protein, partial [Gammaproteobacteria bacterium]|nr:cell division protein ZipA C-terminal FtsZ-binding domain-containing protein [Gammaproteobacteria bacterium]
MSLRVLLVIIGVCIIAGIYLWEDIRIKRSGKRPTEVVFDHDLMAEQEIGAAPGSDETDIYAFESPRLSNSVKRDPEDVSGISISARDNTAASGEDEQIPLILHDVIEPDDKPVAVRESEQDADSTAGITEEQLLVLVIAPDAQEFFNGLDILTATKAAGMKFGNMNIFHHYGPGDRKLPAPLFSLANLYEPGEFDLKSM